MLNRLLSWSLLTIMLTFTPVAAAFAEDNGDNGGSLLEGPFVILAFATVIIMIYYAFRD
ncbi:hypothetical protein LGQ02_11840 [Bacillus shivajii]|uniref:hypothetical protein n=1 Tax=Bacillus shivajii TaxID=1983719 RepID=UPI001CFB0A6C|nr:hypothetical protein [Bacillus shivajii]UCZ51561.1 hypothetical protein LGQ02_11840 [Bacillus shivajii]